MAPEPALTVLALDCSTTACSAASWRNGEILSRRFEAESRGQAERIMPMIEDVMQRAGLGFADLDLIAVTVGPGAFTGLRIGLAAAKGLALAAKLPIAGISTTLAVAAAIPEQERRDGTLISAVESKRKEIYVQAFSADLSALDNIAALSPAEIASRYTGPAVLAGERAWELAPLMPAAKIAGGLPQPDAAIVAMLAARQWPAATLPALPVYLRPPDVTLPG